MVLKLKSICLKKINLQLFILIIIITNINVLIQIINYFNKKVLKILINKHYLYKIF